MSEAASGLLDADAYRDDFPILSRLVHDDQPLAYLDSAATTQSPRQVVEQWEVVYQQVYSNVHRGAHWLSEESTERYELTRETVRHFINASSTHEIVFTSGTTAAINLVARSWGDAEIKSGDELLVTQMEHHSNFGSLAAIGRTQWCPAEICSRHRGRAARSRSTGSVVK